MKKLLKKFLKGIDSDSTLCVFLVGSVVRNKSWVGTDVDLNIITNDTLKREIHNIDNQIFDCWYFPLSYITKKILNCDLKTIAYVYNSEFLKGDRVLYKNLINSINQDILISTSQKIFEEATHTLNEAFFEQEKGDKDAAIILFRKTIFQLVQSLLLFNLKPEIQERYILKSIRQLARTKKEFKKIFQDLLLIHGIHYNIDLNEIESLVLFHCSELGMKLTEK